MMFDYVILTPVHPPEDEPIPGCGIDDIQKALISNGFSNVEIMNNAYNPLQYPTHIYNITILKCTTP
jgi:hypothetical protein